MVYIGWEGSSWASIGVDNDLNAGCVFSASSTGARLVDSNGTFSFGPDFLVTFSLRN